MSYIEKSYLGEICAWVEWTRHQKGSCENGNQSYGSSSGKRIWGETEARKGGGWPSIGKMEGRELIACDMVCLQYKIIYMFLHAVTILFFISDLI